MKLNGALKPHHGAPALGRSIDAKKYRDERYERRHSRRMLSNCNLNDSFEQVQQETDQEQGAGEGDRQQKTDEGQLGKHSTSTANRTKQLRTLAEDYYYDKVTQICRTRFTIKREKPNIAEGTTEVVTEQEEQQKVLQERTLTATRSQTAAFFPSDNSDSCPRSTLKMTLHKISDETSEQNRQPMAAYVLLKWFSSVLWPLIASVGYNAIEHTKATATKLVRVQQSLVPERSNRSAEMNRSTTTRTEFGIGVSSDLQRNDRQHGTNKSVAVPKFILCLIAAIALLPHSAVCDDGDNFFGVNTFSMGPETTTPEFDYASRGQKKFGDKCDNTLECGFPGSICDPKKKSCQCTEDLPVTNHIDKCGKEAAVNESCFFNEQCEVKYFQTECRDGRCVCRFEMLPIWGKDGSVECKGRQEKRGPETYFDPAMIGVLVGMALMFIIICVVLRLFSQARWRENRTIFNTPNPRLMNVSLLRDSKLLHGQERRGSRMSVRAPSRQPSMASLRPHSPNPSLGSNSHNGSNASGGSVRSNSVAPAGIMNSQHHERKSSSHHQHQQHHHQPHQHHQQQQHEPLITNITANPGSESVTVEIIAPEKK